MLQLKEIKALYRAVEKVKQKRMELKQVEATAAEALRSLGSSGIPKSKPDQNRFATCLAILTMFAYEFQFLKGHKTNDDGNSLKEAGSGRKFLLKFLEPAFAAVDANSKPNRDKGIRERIKNALLVLIEGSPPLFSDLFIAEVLQGSFSIPTEDTWKHHFPFLLDEVTSGSTLKKQKSNKNSLGKRETRTRDRKIQKRIIKSKDSTDSATGVLVRKGKASLIEALNPAFSGKYSTTTKARKGVETETAKVARSDVSKDHGTKQMKMEKEARVPARVPGKRGKPHQNEGGKNVKKFGTVAVAGVSATKKKQHQQLKFGLDEKRSTDQDLLPKKVKAQTGKGKKPLKEQVRVQQTDGKNVQKLKAVTVTRKRGVPAKRRQQLDLSLGKKMVSASDLDALANKVHIEMKKDKDNGVEMKEGRKRAQPRTKSNEFYNKGGVPAKKRQRLGVSLEKKEPQTPDTASAAAPAPSTNGTDDIKGLRRSPRKKNRLIDRNETGTGREQA